MVRIGLAMIRRVATPAASLPISCLVAAVGAVAAAAAAAAGAPSAPDTHGAAAIVWERWAPETFARARAEGRLVLLDAAAEWCHWCHVMDRTTYAAPAVRRLVADRFIPVKVDVDREADVGERYSEWGWPATILFTPGLDEMRRLRGYVPPDRFAAILRSAVAEYDRTGGKGPFLAADPPPPPVAPGSPTEDEAAALRSLHERELDAYWDPRLGGWGYRQKASTPMNIEHAFFRFLAAGPSPEAPVGPERSRNAQEWKHRALFTLDALPQIMDPVWGGLYQYSTDGDWKHPHYEKLMTYQAPALASYAQAAVVDPAAAGKHLRVARELYRYIREFLTAPDGTFYATQDADVRRPHAPPVEGDRYYALGDRERRALGIPRIDTRIYARENGLAIAALCQLHAATLDPAVLASAVRATDRVLETHRTPAKRAPGTRAKRAPGSPASDASRRTDREPASGGLAHEPVTGPGAAAPPLLTLGDNAAFARAALAVYEQTGKARYFEAAAGIARFMRRELLDDRDGGFCATPPDPAAVGVLRDRRKPLEDNIAAGRFLLRLALHTQDEEWRSLAARTLRWASAGRRPAELGRFVGWYLTFLEESLTEPVHVTVVGRPDRPEARALLAQAHLFPAPHKIVEVHDPFDGEGRSPPVGFPAVAGAAAFVCAGGACSLPIREPDRFAARVKSILARSIRPSRPRSPR
jgi:uncharacterized protein YyaL (SSP411 family)